MLAVDEDDEWRVAALHELPMFLPADYIQSTILPAVVYTIVGLTVLFVLVNRALWKQTSSSAKRFKSSYQFVNGAVNLTLGIMGIYYCATRVTLPSQTRSIEERVTTTVQEHSQVYWLSCMQLGYQLWALPVGLFVVQESTAMLCHHVAVIGVASLSAFFTNGFVFHNAYFFGLMELSSVPLAIMNFYKDNPKLQQKHPRVYSTVRVIFAVMFLFIRIYMMIPRKADFLRLSWYLLKTSPYWQQQVYLGACWLGSFFLACLQLFWGTLIAKGIVKMVVVRPNNKNTTASAQNGHLKKE